MIFHSIQAHEIASEYEKMNLRKNLCPVPQRSRARVILSAAILLVFFGWLVYHIYSHREDFGQIFSVPLKTLVFLYLLYIVALFLSGLFTKYVTDAFSVRLTVFESFVLSIGTSAANYLAFFRGGAGVRAIYLKLRHGFSFTDFLSSLMILSVLQLFVSSLLGLIGLGMLVSGGKPFDLPLSLFFGITVLACLGAMLCDIRIKEGKHFPLKQISGIINNWALMKKHPRLILMFIFISTIYFIVIALQTRIAFAVYGVDLSWDGVVFYSAGQIPVSYANLTPGGLGIQEAFTIYMGRALQYTPTQAVLVQALIRFVSITSMAVFGPLAIAWLTRSTRPARNNNIERQNKSSENCNSNFR